jgi:thiosulfate reductase cytochrome b subunit
MKSNRAGDAGFALCSAGRTESEESSALSLAGSQSLPTAPAAARKRPRKLLVARHSLTVRITHWINAASLAFLLLSGLQIFNAHPALYWGQQSDFGHAWLAMGAYSSGGALHGVTKVGPALFHTTGVLGASPVHGVWTARGFPDWLTIPPQQFLALGRRWHFFFAWVFAVNGAIFIASAIVSGHLRHDLAPTWGQLQPGHVVQEIWDHLRLRFPKGEAARRYNVLQKLAYLGVLLALLPLMVLTGMTMSPSLDAIFPILVELFGGRQSARSIHFIVAGLIVAFFFVHIVMVVLSGTWNNVRSMITGRYAIEVETPTPALAPVPPPTPTAAAAAPASAAPPAQVPTSAAAGPGSPAPPVPGDAP